MKTGIFSGTVNGTVNNIIDEATRVERDGFAC